MKKFISFGNVNLNILIGRLFWFGNIPIALYSYIFMGHFFLKNNTDEIIKQSNVERTSVSVCVPLKNNSSIDIFIFIAIFVSSVILWKLLCEIIFIIVRYFISNTDNNSSE